MKINLRFWQLPDFLHCRYRVARSNGTCHWSERSSESSICKLAVTWELHVSLSDCV